MSHREKERDRWVKGSSADALTATQKAHGQSEAGAVSSKPSRIGLCVARFSNRPMTTGRLKMPCEVSTVLGLAKSPCESGAALRKSEV
jgi:hypothetical protein